SRPVGASPPTDRLVVTKDGPSDGCPPVDAPRSPRCSALRRLLIELGEPSYRLNQVLHAVHRRGVTEFARMSALPRAVRSALAERLGHSWISLHPLAVQHGTDVEKVLFTNAQHARVETVLLHY